MGKRTREAKAKAAAEAVASTSAAPFLALEDKDEGLDAIFAKTYAVRPCITCPFMATSC